jgi:hypothetical protein
LGEKILERMQDKLLELVWGASVIHELHAKIRHVRTLLPDAPSGCG